MPVYQDCLLVLEAHLVLLVLEAPVDQADLGRLPNQVDRLQNLDILEALDILDCLMIPNIHLFLKMRYNHAKASL
jgi:hypothetical protein